MKALKCQVKEIAVGWLKLEEALHRDFTWFKKKKKEKVTKIGLGCLECTSN